MTLTLTLESETIQWCGEDHDLELGSLLSSNLCKKICVHVKLVVYLKSA